MKILVLFKVGEINANRSRRLVLDSVIFHNAWAGSGGDECTNVFCLFAFFCLENWGCSPRWLWFISKISLCFSHTWYPPFTCLSWPGGVFQVVHHIQNTKLISFAQIWCQGQLWGGWYQMLYKVFLGHVRQLSSHSILWQFLHWFQNLFAVLKTQDNFHLGESTQCFWDLATLLRFLEFSVVSPFSAHGQSTYKEMIQIKPSTDKRVFVSGWQQWLGWVQLVAGMSSHLPEQSFPLTHLGLWQLKHFYILNSKTLCSYFFLSMSSTEWP